MVGELDEIGKKNTKRGKQLKKGWEPGVKTTESSTAT